MRIRNLHLLFHPLDQAGVRVRIASRLGVDPGGSVVDVSVSPRLGEAIRQYTSLLDRIESDEINVQEVSDSFAVLGVWIGRLLWENLFCAPDGSPNAVGNSVLNSLDDSRKADRPLRILLRLGMLPRMSPLTVAPWTSLLFRRRGTRELQSVAMQPRTSLLQFHAVARTQRRFAERKHQQIVTLLTQGDETDVVVQLATDLHDWLEKHKSEFLLLDHSTINDLNDVSTSHRLAVDLWLHVGHGRRHSLDDSAQLVIQSPRGLKAIDGWQIERTLRYFSPHIAFLSSCHIGDSTSGISGSVTNRILGESSHVIGFPRFSIDSAARGFAFGFLKHLGNGCDVEEAVARGRDEMENPLSAYTTDAALRDRDVPIEWWRMLPTVHTGEAEAPPEFEPLGAELDSFLEQLRIAATALLHRHADDELLDRTEYLIDPVAQDEQSSAPVPALGLAEEQLGLVHDQPDIATRPLLVIGSAGMGKSTFLQFFARALLEREESKLLPVVLSFRTFNQFKAGGDGSDSRPFEALSRALHESHAIVEDAEHRAQLLERLHSRGRIVLLLDAFDEVVDLADAQSLRTWQRFLAPLLSSPRTRVVVACRRELAEARAIEQLFPQSKKPLQLRLWTVQDVENYFSKRLQRPATSLLSWAREILTTPLFARLAAESIAREDANAPTPKALLLRAVAVRWAGREERKTQGRHVVTQEEILELSRHAAHHTTARSLRSVNMQSLLDAMTISSDDAVVRTPQASMQALTLHTLLTVREGRARFAYDQFRYYFAADYLARYLERTVHTDALTPFADYRTEPPAEVVEYLSSLLSEDADDGNAWSLKLRQRLTKACNAPDVDLAHLFLWFILPLCSRLDADGSAGDAAGTAGDVVGQLPDVTISGTTLSSLSLSRFRFEDCHFALLDFDSCRIRHVAFLNCTFERCDFRESTIIESTTFDSCTFLETAIRCSGANCTVSDITAEPKTKAALEALTATTGRDAAKSTADQPAHDSARSG